MKGGGIRTLIKPLLVAMGTGANNTVIGYKP